MPHPGSIIFANPPDEAGWHFFYVVYLPGRRPTRSAIEPKTGSRCR